MTDLRNAAGPGGVATARAESDNRARNASSCSILPQSGAFPTADDTLPTLDGMTPYGRRVALAYWESGFVAGISAGRQQVEAELVAEWSALRAEVMPRLRAAVPFADLAEMRDQPERADHQRKILAERGVTP